MKKNFCIIGATSGLGLNFVKKNIKKNYIYCIGQNFNELDEFIKSRKLKKNYKKIKVNLNNKNSFNVYKLFKKKLDLIIHFAGIHKHNMIKFFDDKDLDQTLQVNLISPTKIICKLYANNKINNNANIIILSSIQGSKVNVPGSLAYSMSKAGLNAVIKCLAREMSSTGVKVNAISPAMIKTPLLSNAHHLSKKSINQDKKKYLIGNDYLKINEILNVIDFLISKKQTKITGQNIIVDSGYTLF